LIHSSDHVTSVVNAKAWVKQYHGIGVKQHTFKHPGNEESKPNTMAVVFVISSV